MYTIYDYLKYYKNTSLCEVKWNSLDSLMCAILVYLPVSSFADVKSINELYDYALNYKKDFPSVMIPMAYEVLELIKDSKRYEKLEISNFIKQEEDIIVPVVKYKNRYISLDGHTRLFYAVLHGFTRVKAYIPKVIDFDYMFFVNEARERNINNIKDMKKLSHSEFDLLWNKFCDENNKKNIN